MGNDYRIWALFSALFAGMTAVLAKKGVGDVPSNLALLIRVIVVTIFAFGIAIATKQTAISQVTRSGWIFLTLSGVATGASWLCYFRALQLGSVNKVAPLDKLSFVIAMALGMIFLHEHPGKRTLLGAAVIVTGIVLTLS